MGYFRTRGFRTLVEYLCGAAAQVGVWMLFAGWFTRASNSDYVMGVMGFMAVVVAGPQVVFILHSGDEREKVHMASGYLGLSIFFPFMLYFIIALVCLVVR